MKIRSVVLRKIANRQTNRHREKDTDKRRVKHNLLGRGNNSCHVCTSESRPTSKPALYSLLHNLLQCR